MRHALIIRNPKARRARPGAELLAAAQPLRDLGWEIDLETTAGAGEATAIARQAAEHGVSVVVAAGGDGTVLEVANGLAGGPAGARPALAVVPGGTANVWAIEAGIPHDPLAALMLLERGRRATVDLGRVAIGEGPERRFLLMCSTGIDAEVVRRVEGRPGLKRRLGRAAFVWPSLRAVFAGRATEATVVADGETTRRRLLLAVAGNTRLYGGLLQLTGAARMDDGLLDLVTFEASRGWMPGVLGRVLLALRAARGGLATARTGGIEYQRVRELTIEPERALPVQADGEYIGDCSPGAPLRIAVDPAAIEVVLARRPTPLLGESLI